MTQPMTNTQLFGVAVQRPAVFALAAFALAALQGADANLSLFFLHRQDRWLLLVGVLLLALCVWRLPAREREFSGSWRLALAIGTLMAIAAFAGHYLILSGYDLSRDEQMATFDAQVFAQGQLVAPLSGIWRDHADALNTMFMYSADSRVAWVSDYLPLNAALRAMFGLAATPTLTGPLMTLLGAVALYGCIRRIWPADRETAVVGLLLYAGSAQILVNGMTAYAMPAHLALNLCWLWLFLRRRGWADAAAIVVGFVAVGLHQPLMHPMFAGPILVLLLLERSWRRAALYFAGYAAIGLFWAWWPHWISTLTLADGVIQQVRDVGYPARLLSALAMGDGSRIANMLANLLRFVAWQHLLLVPLLALGFLVARRDRLAGALAAGVLLTIAIMTVILPYQGHGFGYRYLHGLIGNFILLAVYGWESIREGIGKWRSMLIGTTYATLFILLPLQLWMAHGFYASSAVLSARIDHIDADYVVIGGGDVPFSADLIINPPLLDRKPVRLLRENVTSDLAKTLCKRGRVVAVIEPSLLKPIAHYYGFGRSRIAVEASRTMAADLRDAGCKVALVQ